MTHRDREGVGEREWHGRWKPFRRGVREVAVVEEVSSVEEPKDLPCLYYTHRRSFLSPTHCFWVGEVAFVEEVSPEEEPKDLLCLLFITSKEFIGVVF